MSSSSTSATWKCALESTPLSIAAERDRFESSHATRLNRAVGLYFGWRP